MIPFYFAYDIEAPLVDAITISRIVTYLLIGAGIRAVIIIIYSAFLMVTAAGEPEFFIEPEGIDDEGIFVLPVAD